MSSGTNWLQALSKLHEQSLFNLPTWLILSKRQNIAKFDNYLSNSNWQVARGGTSLGSGTKARA